MDHGRFVLSCHHGIFPPKSSDGRGIPNRVTVTLDDGSVLVEEMAFPPGHDKNPLDDAGLATKIHRLTDPVLGRARAEEIWSRGARLESHTTPHTVSGLLDL